MRLIGLHFLIATISINAALPSPGYVHWIHYQWIHYQQKEVISVSRKGEYLRGSPRLDEKVCLVILLHYMTAVGCCSAFVND